MQVHHNSVSAMFMSELTLSLSEHCHPRLNYPSATLFPSMYLFLKCSARGRCRLLLYLKFHLLYSLYFPNRFFVFYTPVVFGRCFQWEYKYFHRRSTKVVVFWWPSQKEWSCFGWINEVPAFWWVEEKEVFLLLTSLLWSPFCAGTSAWFWYF